MSDNPYKPPSVPSQAYGVKSGRHDDLRSVALFQKGIIVCILIYFAAVVFQIFVPPQLRFIILGGILFIGLSGTVFVFLLAIKVYSPGVGVLLGFLTFVPCIGLLVLLIVNGKATEILKRNGIKVGLLGANLSQL